MAEKIRPHPSRARVHLRTWFAAGKYVPWLVLAVFSTGTFFLWKSVRYNSEEEMRLNFDYRVREIVMRIEQRMMAYEQVLRGAHGFFASSQFVDRNEFRSYYKSLQLERNFPGMQGLGFSLLVKPSEKGRHIRAVRREFDPSYAIKPEGERDVYTSIIYLEPFSWRNRRAFGYDMYSEPARHAAMARAADSGAPVITGKLTLVQETNEDVQAGFLMFLPVYAKTGALPAPSARAANVEGWVYAPFRMNDLMTDLLGEHEPETDIEIYDGESTSDAALMYDSDRARARRSDANFQTECTVGISGHFWTLVVRSTPEFEAAFDARKPLVTAAAGIGASILLALLTMLLVNSRARALEALRVEARYKNLMQRANDGILLVDMERRITDANEQACSHFGYSIDELRTMRIEELHSPESRSAVIAQFESLRTTESARFEVLNYRKDGTLVTDEISERIVRVGDEEYVLKFVRDISERKRAEHEREKLVDELQSALADVKTLSGLIPICSSCKKIRDDKGYWNVLESYLIEHSDAQFTHGVCPDCMKKLYPRLADKKRDPSA